MNTDCARMGRHSHDYPSMSQLRWYSFEPLPPWSPRICCESRIRTYYEYGMSDLYLFTLMVLIFLQWYSSAEQPLRLEAYYCTNGIATMFGGLIGYAVGHIKSGLPRWMYVFLIFGSCSIVMGIVTLLFLPDLPTTAKFLKEHERIVAVDRVASNRQGVKNRHFKKYQAWQTLYDPKTWILFVMATGAQIPNSALTSVSFPVSMIRPSYL